MGECEGEIAPRSSTRLDPAIGALRMMNSTIREETVDRYDRQVARGGSALRHTEASENSAFACH